MTKTTTKAAAAAEPRVPVPAIDDGLYNMHAVGVQYDAPPLPATGATAGIPGTWTPAGSAPPATVAALQAGIPNPVTATPATPWTTGQFVQTATAAAPGRATWTGSAWVGGPAPLADADEPAAKR